MNLHIIEPAAGHETPALLLHFGCGLVGGAISRCIVESPRCRRTAGLPVPWSGGGATREFSESVKVEVERLLDDDSGRHTARGGRSLGVIWSAGAAGFSCNEREAEAELRNFHTVLELCGELRDEFGFSSARFLHVSSVGGLFEGHCRVSSRVMPHEQAEAASQRPYGWLKLKQERALSAHDAAFESHVYRLPTIFGVPGASHRWGLVATLIHNALHDLPTPIVRRVGVLRDYVWNVDVGRYLAEKALSAESRLDGGISYLASGKPTSIAELIRRTERLVGRRLRYTVRSQWDNCDDITVSPRALPADWKPTSLEFSMRSIYGQFLMRKVAGTMRM